MQRGAREAGLGKGSVVNLSQVLTVDMTLLTERAGHLPPDRLADVQAGLREVMGL